jgi:Tol biopolymer transport system component
MIEVQLMTATLTTRRALGAFVLATLLAACSTPSAAPPTLLPTTPTPAALATTTAPAPTSMPLSEPALTPASEPTAAALAPTSAPPATAPSDPGPEPGTGDAQPERTPQLIYRRAGGLWRVGTQGEPPALLIPDPEGQATPWAASPDGTALAFVRATGIDAKGQVAGQPSVALYLIGRDLPGERKLLELLPPGGVDLTPGEEASMGLLPALTGMQKLAWSPDGSRVVLVSAHEGQVDLYAVGRDGGISRLSDTPELETQPAWSPDGALVAAATLRSFGTGAGWADVGLVVAHADGSGPLLAQDPIKMADTPMAISQLIWADATTLLIGLPAFFDSQSQVRAIDVASGEATYLYRGSLRGMAWSDAARALAISAADFGEPDSTPNPGLFLWRPGMPEAARLGELPLPLRDAPVWSPNGEELAVSADDPGELGGVWIVPLDPERGPRQLSATPAYALAWSPDSKLLASGGELWHRNGSPVDPLPGSDVMPLGFTADGLFFASRDEPSGPLILRFWSELGTLDLDRDIAPFDAALAELALSAPPALDPAGLLPDSYRAYEGEAGFTVVALDPASGRERELGVLADEVARVWAITPAPDGSAVAVEASNEDNQALLYVVAAGEARLLARGPLEDSLGGWSADGTHLLLRSTRDAEQGCPQRTCPYDLFVIDIASGEETRLTTSEDAEPEAAFSPDGGQVAFSRGCIDVGIEECGPSLHLIERDGSGERLLVSGWISGFAFSPDGSQIAYEQRADGTSSIFLVPSAGGEPVRLTDGGAGQDVQPRWSPDGRTIAFSRINGVCQVESCGEAVYVVPATGGEPRLLYQGAMFDRLVHAGWSPRGEMLLALREQGERARLLAYSPEGALVGAAWVTLPLRAFE